MSSTKQRGMIVFLIVASCIGIGILAARKIFFFSCPNKDTQICAFLKNYNALQSSPIHGTYTFSNNGDDTTYTVNWQRHKEKRIISVVQKEEPILDAIITHENLYLMDYSDKSWWKESLSDIPLYSSYIPFDPYSYFFELNPILMDPGTIYTRIGESKCADKTCVRYEVKSGKQSPNLQRFIYIRTSDYQLYSVVDAESSAVHDVKILGGSQWIYEPKQTKTPSPTQNIFLDYITRRDRERDKQLEYLKKFQDERKKAEQLNTTDLKYVEDSKQSTPSGN